MDNIICVFIVFEDSLDAFFKTVVGGFFVIRL